jgi:anti-anti-sigma factor
MKMGKILVAQHLGAYVIKLVGDVRLTLCVAIDEYFNRMFDDPEFVGVVVDLSKAEGIDSTTLGMLAKLAIRAKRQFQHTPMILSPNPDINRLLSSMGFGKVFTISDSAQSAIGPAVEVGELEPACNNEDCVKAKIIEAHQVLMSMNDKNKATFSALMSNLVEASS